MKTFLFAHAIAALCLVGVVKAETCSRSDLREIDTLASMLTEFTKELHEEFHLHLEGTRFTERLDGYVAELEKQADQLHEKAHNDRGGRRSMIRMREATNELILLSDKTLRTTSLMRLEVSTRDRRQGLRHMRTIAREIVSVVLDIDSFLPVDTQVIDSQASRLEEEIRFLHEEFHESFEGYPISRHMDKDLVDLERLVGNLHRIAHKQSWKRSNLKHITRNADLIEKEAEHLESLILRQAEEGIRYRNLAGVDSMQESIANILSSSYLLKHMARKAERQFTHEWRSEVGSSHYHGRHAPRTSEPKYRGTERQNTHRSRSTFASPYAYGFNAFDTTHGGFPYASVRRGPVVYRSSNERRERSRRSTERVDRMLKGFSEDHNSHEH